MDVPPKTLHTKLSSASRNRAQPDQDSRTQGSDASVSTPVVETQALAEAAPQQMAGPSRRQTETMPIMKAFEEFLAVEHERTARKIRRLAAVICIIMVAAGGMILAGISLALGNMRSDMADFRNEIQVAADKAQEIRNEVRMTLSGLENGGPQGPATGLAAAMAAYTNEMAALKQTIDSMHKEDKLFREEVSPMRDRWHEMAATVDSLLKEMATLRSDLSLTEKSEPEVAALRQNTLSLVISPPGQDAGAQGMAWRIPIPE